MECVKKKQPSTLTLQCARAQSIADQIGRPVEAYDDAGVLRCVEVGWPCRGTLLGEPFKPKE